MIPSEVRIVEVGPRDGLQNEKQTVPVDVKVALIESLANAGLRTIEAGSFVSPDWVPQMADTDAVLKQLRRGSGIRYPVLVPNEKGLEAALDSGANDIAVFTAASETFCQRNINCSIAESLGKIRAVVERALARGLRVRGYISCVLGCPYEGEIRFEAVTTAAKELWQMGCQEISLGDTIGVGTPVEAQKLLELRLERHSQRRIRRTPVAATAATTAPAPNAARCIEVQDHGSCGCASASNMPCAPASMLSSRGRSTLEPNRGPSSSVSWPSTPVRPR